MIPSPPQQKRTLLKSSLPLATIQSQKSEFQIACLCLQTCRSQMPNPCNSCNYSTARRTTLHRKAEFLAKKRVLKLERKKQTCFPFPDRLSVNPSTDRKYLGPSFHHRLYKVNVHRERESTYRVKILHM